MPKNFIIISALFLFLDANAQNIMIQPNPANNESNISVTVVYGCDVFVENMSHSVNGFVVAFDIEVDTILNHPPCSFDPPPPIVFTYPVGQLPTGEYEFVLNTTDLVDNSVSQRSVMFAVGAAPTPVPLNTNLLILFVLGFGFIWLRKTRVT